MCFLAIHNSYFNTDHQVGTSKVLTEINRISCIGYLLKTCNWLHKYNKNEYIFYCTKLGFI